MSNARILIVEDQFLVAQDLCACLRKFQYTVLGICTSGAEALEKARLLRPQLVLMDISIKGEMDGIEIARRWNEEMDVRVVYLTGRTDEVTLQRAASTSPAGYILKPFEERQLHATIELALKRLPLDRAPLLDDAVPAAAAVVAPEVLVAPAPIDETQVDVVPRARKEFAEIIGSHPSMLQLLKNTALVAKTDVAVHIYGENGTGKELVANALHRLSARRERPFVKINCSAIPGTLFESALFGHNRGAFTGATANQEGFIERAEGGTLFLDEIGDLSADMQVKLLRVLQSRDYHRVGETCPREADVRIITATNRDLRVLLKEGRIREDFYYRIHVFPLEIPALRNRGDDVSEIAEHYRSIFNRMFTREVIGFSASARRLLLEYGWPGNVRELENAIRRAFVLVSGTVIEPEHLGLEAKDGALREASLA